MTFAVVAYPVLDAASQTWIEAVRGAHDPQVSRIAAHFTLVFPVDERREAMASLADAAAQAQAPFEFAIETVAAVRDAFGDGGHVFLVPSDGAREIRAMHDRLYDGVLHPHLRTDIPFTPHLTVAANRDFSWCERCAAELSGRLPKIIGRVDRLTLVEIGDRTIERVAEYPLAQ